MSDSVRLPRFRPSIQTLRPWAFFAALVIGVALAGVLIVWVAIHGPTVAAGPMIGAAFLALLALAGVHSPWGRR